MGVTLVPLPAAAENSTLTGSWYFAEQPEPAPPPVGAPAPVPTPDVPSGDFPAAAKPASTPAQQSDKESYLHIDVSAAPQDGTLSALKLTLKEDSAGGNLNASSAVVEAHLVTEFFADGAAGNPYSQRPKYDAAASAKGARAADGTWTFDLGSLVKGKAVSSFYGVALIPAPASPGDGFEVVWSGKDSSATYSVAAAAAGAGGSGSGTAGGFGSATAPSSGATSSGSTKSGSTSSATGAASSGAVASGAGSNGGGSFLSSPSAVATPDVATTVPAASGPAAAAAPATPAASTTKKSGHTKHGLPWTFLPAVVLVLVLLGGAAVALGQAGEPVPARQGSVVRRLERPVDVLG